MQDHDDSYQPISGRRRLLIGLLAVATAITVMWLLLNRPGGPRLTRPAVPLCQAGQSDNCVGGKASVIAPAASAGG